MSPTLSVQLRKHRQFVFHYVVVACLLALSTWAAYLLFEQPELAIDDARIFFVYGENISSGNGIVYNNGGERVEGFTSPLWLIFVTLGIAIFNSPDVWLLLFSMLTLSGAIAALWYFEVSRKLISWQSALFVVWLIGVPSYVVWMSLPLMDVTIWSSIIIISAIITIRGNSPRGLAISIVFLVLARPEGVLWGLVFMSLFAMNVASKYGISKVWSKLRLPFAAYFLTVTVLFGARMAYFGYLMPNTYYAKVSPDLSYSLGQGSIFLLAFVAANLPAMMIVLWSSISGILFNLPRFIREVKTFPIVFDTKLNVRYLIVSTIAITGLLIPVLSGGDHFRLFRFYQPIWPLFLLPILELFMSIQLKTSKAIKYGLLFSFLVLIVFSTAPRWDTLANDFFTIEFIVAEEGSNLGKQLNRMFEHDPPIVGVPAAGGVALEYDGPVVDIYGLNNVAMAHSAGSRYGLKNHSAFNSDVFLKQQPDLFWPVVGTREALLSSLPDYEHSTSLNSIYSDHRFIRLYALVLITDSDAGIRAFVRRDYLDILINRGFDVMEIDY